VLADFQTWLAALPAEPAAGAPEGPPVDLQTLLGQMAGLRTDVTLQIKTVRAQQEHYAEALRQLSTALEMLRQSQSAVVHGQQLGQEEHLRPLLKTLVDLHDALARAAREIQKVQERLPESLPQVEVPPEPPPEAPPEPAAEPSGPAPQLPWWGRWLGLRPPDNTALMAQVRQLQTELLRQRQQQRETADKLRELGDRLRQGLTSLLEGYTMSVQRIERALRQHGLENLEVVGQPFDPELMEVLEVVQGSGRPSGEVVEEVRRGYLLGGRIFRYAQVRVARD
jgi:molecular chaperone GrpE